MRSRAPCPNSAHIAAGHPPPHPALRTQIAELLPRNSSEEEGGRQAGKQARLHTKSHVRFEGEGRYGASRERSEGELASGEDPSCEMKRCAPCSITRYSPLCIPPPSPPGLFSFSPSAPPALRMTLIRFSTRVKNPNCVAYDRRPAMSEVPTAVPSSSPSPLFFASSPQGENAANLHTSLTQAGNESWIPVVVYLALPSGPAVRRDSCFPPLAAGGEESGNSIAAVSIGNPDRVFGHGRPTDGRMGRTTDKAADRPTDLRCRKMFQKSVTKWDWMGTLHNCGRGRP